MKNLSIRTKLILLIFGLTGLILAGVLILLASTTKNDIKKKIINNFQETQVFFKKQQTLVYDRLIESCLLIGENATFKANVDLQDPNSVMEAVREFANYTKTDLMIVTDATGKILAWLDEPEKTGQQINDWFGIQEAIDGIDPEENQEWPVLWEVDDLLYQVVSVPIIAGESVLGSISLGIQYTSHEAYDLKGGSNVEISLFLKDQLLASTIPEERIVDRITVFGPLIKTHLPVINEAIEKTKASEPFEVRLGNEPAYAYVSPLGKGVRAFYIATAWENEEMSVLNDISNKIIWIGLASFLLTGLLAFFTGSRITKPIMELADGMEQVKQGDFQVHLIPSGDDEIGQLTRSFNEMIQVLKEQMFLKKYVGGHTLDMIQSEGEGVSLSQGKRMIITVLFSDIRNFTKYSEDKKPEEVINLLNTYLGFQAELVAVHQGIVDKYVGDEMVALFTGPNAIQNAMDCAQKIQEHSAVLYQKIQEPISLGIGINSGPVIMGNIGNQDRMDYTVIGAAVNLGARLCSRAKGGEILFRADLAKDLKYDELEEMKFKGITTPLKIAKRKIEV